MSDDARERDEIVTDQPEPDPGWEALVRQALDDPLPADVLARSLDLWQLTSIDAELAQLLAEESADAELAGVRSATLAVTAFTFVAGEVTIELEWDGEVLSGQVFPGEPATLELHDGRGSVLNGSTNSVGTFELTPEAGSWCLVVVRHAAGAVRTPWFTL
jgi:hypothetical protein